MDLKSTVKEAAEIVEETLKILGTIKLNLIPKDFSKLSDLLNLLRSKFLSLLNESCLSNANEQMTSFYITHLSHYLKDVFSQVKVWKGNLTDSQEEDLVIVLSKMATLSELFDLVPGFPKEDLFSLAKTHPRWEKLNQLTEHFHASIKKQVKQHYRSFMCKVASSQAFISTGYEEIPGRRRYLMIGLGSIFYTFFKKKALKRTQLLYAEPRLEVAMHVWNLLETKMLRNLMKLVMKSINFNKVIYIPRTASHVLEDYSLNSADSSFKLTRFNDCVMIRLLSFHPLSPFCKVATSPSVDKLILHIHGGGFISMSSASHQVYTNIWAREVRVPVISVDYRLAPKHPYPEALDDVWQTWNWLMNYALELIGITPRQYVIVGDSAGGNLALALTYKIIKSGLRPPDGLVLAYPALNLNKENFSPSLMYSLEDLLVPHTFLKLCIEAYLNGYEDTNDPMVSPCFIENEVLEQFPPTKIMVGDEDPLHDDCFRFAEKLNDSGINVNVAVYEGASHGGLSYCFKGGIKETNDMVLKAAEWMKELLD